MFKFYQIKERPSSFSVFDRTLRVKRAGFISAFNSIVQDQESIVQIIAYCLMPTHIHLILKQVHDAGISSFMGNILNSYSRYFNTRHQRKGPLWESKFQNVRIESDEQLLHLTRYIHLNPVTAFLVDRPDDWEFSSYIEFISESPKQSLTQFNDLMEIDPKNYRGFVQERANYQRELAKIKNLLID